MSKSYNEYPSDGATTLFSVTVGFLDRSHIKVFVDGVETAYEWIGGSTIGLSQAPAVGSVVRIARVTPSTPVVDFRDGETLTEEDLDNISLQALYITQESADALGAVLQQDTDGVYDAGNKRLKNLADPVDPADAVTLGHLNTAYDSELALAVAAREAAQTAQTYAEQAKNASEAAKEVAEAKALMATQDASAAVSAASAALTYRNDAEFFRNQAASSATSASTDAATATSKAFEATQAADQTASHVTITTANAATAQQAASEATQARDQLNIDQGLSTADSPSFTGLHVAKTGDATILVQSLGGESDSDAVLDLRAVGADGEPHIYFRRDNALLARVEEISGRLSIKHSTGHVYIEPNGGAESSRWIFHSNGSLGISGHNYGTDGQVIQSKGYGSAPVWTDVGQLVADIGVLDVGSTVLAVYDAKNIDPRATLPTGAIISGSSLFLGGISSNAGLVNGGGTYHDDEGHDLGVGPAGADRQYLTGTWMNLSDFAPSTTADYPVGLFKRIA